jgi:hypothetical protein
MAMIYVQHEELEQAGEMIKDLDIVNYVLANALKGDQIPPEELGLVLSYLDVVQAPPIYY